MGKRLLWLDSGVAINWEWKSKGIDQTNVSKCLLGTNR